MLRAPSVSAQHIAFAYAQNVWVVDRKGGAARRLTSFQGATENPKISPDGKLVAFSAEYGGNTDVYVVPIEGGEPRLTEEMEVGAGINAGQRLLGGGGRAGRPLTAPKGDYRSNFSRSSRAVRTSLPSTPRTMSPLRRPAFSALAPSCTPIMTTPSVR